MTGAALKGHGPRADASPARSSGLEPVPVRAIRPAAKRGSAEPLEQRSGSGSERDSVVHDDRGDVITAYLLRLVGGLAIAGLLLIETAAIAVNHVSLDESVELAANQAAGAYIEHGSPDAAERTARRGLRDAGIELLDVTVRPPEVTVTGRRPASVLLVDRIDALSQLVVPTSSASARVER